MLARYRFEDLLEAIAADAPAPGSGAAAAATLALGIACLRKAVAVSRGDADDAALAEADRRLCGLLEQALAGADADARGFPRLLAARSADAPVAEAEAADDLAALAERIIGLCRQLHGEADALADRIKPAMANDVLAARRLSAAAAAILRANERENGGG